MEYATVNYITINRRIKFRIVTSEILIINLKKNMPRIITANLSLEGNRAQQCLHKWREHASCIIVPVFDSVVARCVRGPILPDNFLGCTRNLPRITLRNIRTLGELSAQLHRCIFHLTDNVDFYHRSNGSRLKLPFFLHLLKSIIRLSIISYLTNWLI